VTQVERGETRDLLRGAPGPVVLIDDKALAGAIAAKRGCVGTSCGTVACGGARDRTDLRASTDVERCEPGNLLGDAPNWIRAGAGRSDMNRACGELDRRHDGRDERSGHRVPNSNSAQSLGDHRVHSVGLADPL